MITADSKNFGTSNSFNSELFERSSHQYVIIMITDVA